jgi:DNA-binding Lrp family transcriptional regulator
MRKIDLNLKILAKISKGTKRNKREINDLEIAEEINSIYKIYNSLSKVAQLLKLSPEMVRQIKSLTTLENTVKNLYSDGILKGYDIGYRISKLRGKDQVILAKHIIDKNFSSDDVRAIVKYKIDNPEMPIEEVINKVIQSKDRQIYVAYLGIEKNTFEMLLNKGKNRDAIKTVKSIFKKVIPSKFITSFELNGRVVILKVTKEGLQEMRRKTKELKVPLAKLADALVKVHLKGVNYEMDKG